MERHELLALLGEIVRLLFVFSFGACVGSLINVLVYRMPLGLGVITPSSKCPACGTKLAWNDNVPVLGWLLLRGRCRYCGVKISPEYVLVEAFTGLLFTLVYALFYTLPALSAGQWVFLGIDWTQITPAWTWGGLERSWPLMFVVFMLLGSLVAMTIVDAKTFMIPLALAWVPTVIAVAVHPLWALWVESSRKRFLWEDGWTYAIASSAPTGWGWIGASIGAVLGLGVSLLLLKAGLIGRSFADYDEWEAKARAEAGLPPLDDEQPDSVNESVIARTAAESKVQDEPPEEDDEPVLPGERTEAQIDADAEAAQNPPPKHEGPEPKFTHWKSLAGWFSGISLFVVLGAVFAPSMSMPPAAGAGLGLLIGTVVGAALARLLRPEPGRVDEEAEQELWLAYPHARREMVRELAFLAPCALLAIGGWYLFKGLGGEVTIDALTQRVTVENPAPLWLEALGASLLGYLVAGGVVWGVRILGSLAFGKEAMGLGDVHLLAAIGACLGWTAGVAAFVIAVPLALYTEIVIRTRWGGRRRAMPFGPALCIGAVLAMLLRPWLGDLLNAWLSLAPESRITLP